MPTMARNSIETSNLWRAKVVQKMVQDNELSSNSSIVVFICSIDAFCVFKTFENSESLKIILPYFPTTFSPLNWGYHVNITVIFNPIDFIMGKQNY